MSLKRAVPLQNIVVSFIVSLLVIALLEILLQLQPNTSSVGYALLALNEELTQSANAVTSVVTYFRSLDTLGEVSILFLSIFGLSLGMKKAQKNVLAYDNTLLKIAQKILFPIILLFGLYIITHGHLSPGGGFQGGVIIASAFLLQLLSRDHTYNLNEKILKIVEALSGAGIILVGVLGVLVGVHFFGNFLPLGTLGELLSGGVIEIIYIFVGIKVAAEIAALAEHFIKVSDV